MKIGLVSALMKDNNLAHQIKQIEYYLKTNNTCDLLVFGESFLQGFEGLTWDYDEDINRGISMTDHTLHQIRQLAHQYQCAISFGMIERDDGALYSSNVFIDAQGELVNVFRRISDGWKEPIATAHYKNGSEIVPFTYKGKSFATVICGDLWDQNILSQCCDLEVDILLWPLYVDFSVEIWQNKFLKEYQTLVNALPQKVLMINSFVAGDERANGGCYLFERGNIQNVLEMGKVGVLEIEV